MAPSALMEAAQSTVGTKVQNGVRHFPALTSKHLLDEFNPVELTPCIGSEFKDVNLVQWMRAPNSDDLIRDLVVMLAERGVVFFRNQKDIDDKTQKELCLRLNKLSGAPAEHGFYRHSLKSMHGEDPEMGKVDPDRIQKMYHSKGDNLPRQTHTGEWHTDSSFEPNPPDYTILKMYSVPKTGGDTLWCSGYEMYERLSPPYKKFFESLTATHKNMGLWRNAQKDPESMDQGPRGAPNNVGLEFESHHPVVRTHPITGWKSIFAAPSVSCLKFDDVTDIESAELMSKLEKLYLYNHDIVVRFRWENTGDIAIWDNRCTFHAATQDHFGKGQKIGWRCMTLGEVPFCDPNSKSRDEATGGWPYKLKE